METRALAKEKRLDKYVKFVFFKESWYLVREEK